MKKIAIVTFHKAHNYGAVLQAYALKYKLEELGHEVNFYNYSPKWMLDHYKLFPKLSQESVVSKIKRHIGYALDFKRLYARHSGFVEFTREYLTEWSDSQIKELDFIVVGSDQVWNSKITDGFDPLCFGVLNDSLQAKVISYAASMEDISLSKNQEKDFIRNLKNIDSIGVREDSLVNYIKGLLKEDAVTHNIDPTLLLSRNEWSELSKPLNKAKPYLLIYENYRDKNTAFVAGVIASKLNLDVKTLKVNASWRDGKEVLSTAAPQDFISLYNNANFSITTSYHGLAFSIINRIPFIYVKVNNGVNNRAVSLLTALGLTNYMVDTDNFNFDEYKEINYDEVYIKLDKLKIESMQYLCNAIGDEK